MKALRRWFLVVLIALSMFATAQTKPARFDLKAVSVAQVVQLMYSEVITTPYILEPDVLTDTRMVSFRYATEKGDLRLFLGTFLDALGYAIQNRDGVDVIHKKPEAAPKAELSPDQESWVYRPQFRDVHYLSRVLAPLFQGTFASNRSIASKAPISDNPVQDGSASALIDQSADVLLFTGTAKEIDKLKKLLPQIDFQLGEVVVRGVVYEVSTTEKEGSAFGLLASLLGGKLQLGTGAINPVGSFLRLKSAALDAVYLVLNQDSRFKVKSSPSLRIRSGSQGTFSVGQDVPVLGSVSYTGNGQAVQSVEYRSSGVIFNILPTVRDGVIELAIDQQLSNFAATHTGVNNSPTLTKRALKTSVGLQDGEVIVLGGLIENKQADTHDGPSFLPSFMHTRGADSSRSEILLVLQVQRL